MSIDPDDLILFLWGFVMQAISETRHAVFWFSLSMSIQSLNDVAGRLQRRDTGMTEGCWQFPSRPRSYSDTETHLLHRPCQIVLGCGHICATDRVLDSSYWDELHSVSKEKIIGIMIRGFLGPCRRCWTTACQWISWTLCSLILIEFGKLLSWCSLLFHFNCVYMCSFWTHLRSLQLC